MSIHRNGVVARRRRAQWGGALLAAVTVVMTPPLGVGSYMLSVAAAGYPLDGTGVEPLGIALVGGVLVVALVIGSALIVSALVGRPRPRPITAAGAVSVIVGTALLCALPLVPNAVSVLLGFPYLVVMALLGFGASACASAWARSTPAVPEPRAEGDGNLVMALVCATLIPLSLMVAGLIEAFVWGPESQTNGLAATEVWAALSEGDAAAARAGIIGWAVISALLSLLPLVVVALTRRTPDASSVERRRATIIAGLFAGGMVATLHWVGTFSLGMSIADTLPPFTGSSSGPGAALIGLGSFLLAGSVFATLVARPAPRAQLSQLPKATLAP